MKIQSVYIKEFGAIRDREITLSEGLNIIEGNNESGKSTLLAFIKFMLYGLPKKSPGEAVTEKDRAFSWSGGLAEGTMTVLTAEGLFRIERSAKASSRAETPKIYDVETGEQVWRGENPGELFFELPLNVFESTACVRQLKCTQLDGSGLGTSIENLMVAADENMSVKKATSRLESIRKRLRHKKGQGGEITELENTVRALEIRMENASEKKRYTADRKASHENVLRVIEETRSKLTEEKELCRAYELRRDAIRFDALHSAEKRVESLCAEERLALDSGAFGGVLPSEGEMAAISESRIKYIQAKENSARLASGLAELESKIAPEEEDDIHARHMEDEGGEQTVSEAYHAKRKEGASALKAGVILLVFAVLFIISGGIAFASGRFIPEIPQFGGKPTAAAAVFAALGIFSAFFGIARLLRASSAKKSAFEYARSFGCEENTREALTLRLATLCRRRSERDSFRQMLLRSQKDLQDSREQEKMLEAELSRRINMLCGGALDSGHSVTEQAEELNLSYRSLADKVGELRRDIDKYSALVQERRRELADVDESEVRRSVTDEMTEKLGDVNITLLRRDVEFLQAKLDSAENKRQALERELIALGASSEDPEKLGAELAEARKNLDKRLFMLDSLELAVDSIAEASEAVRRNITPKLKKQAGEYLSHLSGGRYSELSISPDFTVSVIADGVTRPVEALSSGTRDAAYLSIRLALVSVLYRKEIPALLLDEVLSQIDDTRAQNVLSMLADYCTDGAQCLLFTCHTRESTLHPTATVVKM